MAVCLAEIMRMPHREARLCLINSHMPHRWPYVSSLTAICLAETHTINTFHIHYIVKRISISYLIINSLIKFIYTNKAITDARIIAAHI